MFFLNEEGQRDKPYRKQNALLTDLKARLAEMLSGCWMEDGSRMKRVTCSLRQSSLIRRLMIRSRHQECRGEEESEGEGTGVQRLDSFIC